VSRSLNLFQQRFRTLSGTLFSAREPRVNESLRKGDVLQLFFVRPGRDEPDPCTSLCNAFRVGARIAFLGDTLLGGDAQPVLDREGYDYALAEIAPLVADADLVVANLEGVVSERPLEPMPHRRWAYRARPESLAALIAIGVRVVSLGNNHVLDYGQDGLADTLAALDAAGIARCGAGQDDHAARRPAIVEVAGQRIGFLSALARYKLHLEADGYARSGHGGPARLRSATIRGDLAALEDLDARIALVHWGRNFRPITDGQRRMADALRSSSSAELVVGHHPHIAQTVDCDGRCPILFSIGNAAFGSVGRFAQFDAPPYGLLVTVELDDSGAPAAVEARLLLVDNRVVNYRTRPAEGDEANRVLRALLEPRGEWHAIASGMRWERESIGNARPPS
jgi:Bacterial capsule synthesis protein PGA_cap